MVSLPRVEDMEYILNSNGAHLVSKKLRLLTLRPQCSP